MKKESQVWLKELRKAARVLLEDLALELTAFRTPASALGSANTTSPAKPSEVCAMSASVSESETPSVPTVGCPTAILASAACSLLPPWQQCAARLLLADVDG